MKPVVKKAKGFRARLVKCPMLWLGILALMAWGCATPIGVNYVDRRVAYQSITANMLSAERPSSFSARELMNLNLYQRFEDDPEKALAEMHAGFGARRRRGSSFRIGRAFFSPCREQRRKILLLAAAVYAYAFILPGEHGRPPRAIDPRFRWAADIYNQSLTRAAKSIDGAMPIPMRRNVQTALR